MTTLESNGEDDEFPIDLAAYIKKQKKINAARVAKSDDKQRSLKRKRWGVWITRAEKRMLKKVLDESRGGE